MNAIQWGGVALIGFNIGIVVIRAIATRKQRSEASRPDPTVTDIDAQDMLETARWKQWQSAGFAPWLCTNEWDYACVTQWNEFTTKYGVHACYDLADVHAFIDSF